MTHIHTRRAWVTVNSDGDAELMTRKPTDTGSKEGRIVWHPESKFPDDQILLRTLPPRAYIDDTEAEVAAINNVLPFLGIPPGKCGRVKLTIELIRIGEDNTQRARATQRSRENRKRAKAKAEKEGTGNAGTD